MRQLMLACAALLFATVSAPSARAAQCLGIAPGTSARVAVGTTGRAMLIHVPHGYTGRAPLVLLLHGSTGTGAQMLAESRLAETADRHGFVVAAPDGGIAAGQGYVWNIPGVPTVTGKLPGPGDPNDVAYLAAAIDVLARQGCADRTRVYATGLSGGGRMTSWLGCVAADRFAAIAPVVGLRAGNPSAADPRFPDPATCKPARPMPVIAFAGAKDTTNPVQGGGAGYWQYPMRRAEARWADLNGCRESLAESIELRGYTNCRHGADMIAHIDPQAGHSWVADNEAMWQFFDKHHR
ncbi:prolyl oligopeptidase family serine peptidase [Sphingomonas sp. IC-56]|uniref:alpha/beta hydrolase family esterase n=1 Tax=Sphingomonas sp. IC-56 TaxID=2898529 RepID=UPI001E593654|nr:PHB depolymerase family esterase [Sphingomonas sp. IC-56]MCD2323574.1 prolyl oligopeptidase family serine peptidase [Sphingomonas sp. IC-56]